MRLGWEYGNVDVYTYTRVLTVLYGYAIVIFVDGGVVLFVGVTFVFFGQEIHIT